MSLPDVSRLSSLPKARWFALRERLREIGVDAGAVERVTGPVARIPIPMRRPIRNFHLDRLEGDKAWAMRMLMFEEPIPHARAVDALGERLVGELVDVGFLASRGGEVVSPFLLNLYDEVFFVVDNLRHGDAAVMGSGITTAALTRAVMPRERVGRVLDFGCGAGSTALVLAGKAERVIGTDINPRAITLGRVNAQLNGIENVEFREGDMFAPVEGETFDLIFSQPPFVPMPEGAAAVTYLYGGRRGDEFPLRVLHEVGKHIAMEGRAVIFVEWPDVEDVPLEKRVRAAVEDEALDVLLLRAPPTNLDDYSTWYAANDHPELGAAFEQMATMKRAHFEKTGIRALRQTFNVLRRTKTPPGWTAVVDIRALSAGFLTSTRIGRILAARDLLVHGDDDAVLRACLRVPKKTTFVEERSEPDPRSESRITARFGELVPLLPMSLDKEAQGLVALIHASPDVLTAAKLLAEATNAPLERAIRRLLPHARGALGYGLLEIAEG